MKQQTSTNEIYLMNPQTQQLERFVKLNSNEEIKAENNRDFLYGKPIIACLDYFLEIRKPLVRPRSYDSYKDTVRLLKEWLVTDNSNPEYLNEINQNHAIRFSDYMVTVKKYSGRTHNGHKQHAATIFNEFKRRELIKTNPFLIIHKMPENTQRHVPFTDKEKKMLKIYMDRHNPRLSAFCQIQYYLAIRPLELLQVQVRDINIKEKYVMIWSGNAKNRRQEAVYFPVNCKALFESFKLWKYQPTDYLFGHKLNTNDKQYNRNRVSEMHSAVIKDLQLNSYHTLYSWKHTGACAFHRKYKDLYKLMRHLRQNDINITMVYIRQLGIDFKVNNMPKF